MKDGNALIIWDRLGDYHRARVRAFENRVGREQVFTADFGGTDNLYGWETTGEAERHFALSPKPVDKPDFFRRVLSFLRVIQRNGIRHLAIAGYGRPAYVAFIILGRLAGCRITLFAESWYGENSLRNRLKGAFLLIFCDRFFVSGSRARDHFHNRLGIPAERILTGYSVVDTAHFGRKSGEGREAVLLCVARFSPEKNLGALIDAFKASRLADSCRLRLIGGGGERENLEKRIGNCPAIEIRDWVSYGELPEEYARARWFILPSRFEPWGLVVNEAMAAGLPVIVSRACGCQPDLVTERNGFVFDHQSAGALKAVLDRLVDISDAEWMEMSGHSQALIRHFGCDDWARQLELSFS